MLLPNGTVAIILPPDGNSCGVPHHQTLGHWTPLYQAPGCGHTFSEGLGQSSIQGEDNDVHVLREVHGDEEDSKSLPIL